MAEITEEKVGEQVGEIGLIVKENLAPFRSLLLPDAAEALDCGMPHVALGWTVGSVAAGAIAGAVRGDSFVLSSFYVSPEYRNQGGGGRLIDELTGLLSGEVSQIRVGFPVTEPDHEILEDFLIKRDFEERVSDSNSMFRIKLSDLLSNAMLKSIPASPKVLTLSDANDYDLKKEQKRAMVAGDPIPEGGFFTPMVRKDLSAVYSEKDAIMGYLIVEESESGGLCVSSALNRAGMKAFPLLLRKVLDNLKDKCSEDTVLMIPVINSTSSGIVKKLVPDAKQVYRLFEKVV